MTVNFTTKTEVLNFKTTIIQKAVNYAQSHENDTSKYDKAVVGLLQYIEEEITKLFKDGSTPEDKVVEKANELINKNSLPGKLEDIIEESAKECYGVLSLQLPI